MALKIKSSAKLHRRYLLVSGSRNAIEYAILEYIGTLGWSEADPLFVKVHNGHQVLAINRSTLERVRGAFAVSKEGITVFKASGTLKGLGVQ